MVEEGVPAAGMGIMSVRPGTGSSPVTPGGAEEGRLNGRGASASEVGGISGISGTTRNSCFGAAGKSSVGGGEDIVAKWLAMESDTCSSSSVDGLNTETKRKQIEMDWRERNDWVERIIY